MRKIRQYFGIQSNEDVDACHLGAASKTCTCRGGGAFDLKSKMVLKYFLYECLTLLGIQSMLITFSIVEGVKQDEL